MSDEQPKSNAIDLDGAQDRLGAIFEAVAKLNPDANPTEVVGLLSGAIAGLSFVFIDLAKSMRKTAEMQARLVAIAEADLTEIVNDAIKEGVDKGVEKRLSQRSFIGKPPDDS